MDLNKDHTVFFKPADIKDDELPETQITNTSPEQYNTFKCLVEQ